jgi:hypothetical protein
MTSYNVTVNPRGANEVIFSDDTTLLADKRGIEKIKISDSKQQSFQSASFVLIDVDKTFYDSISIGSIVEIEINDVLQFEVFVSHVKKSYAGSIVLELQCVGNTFELERFRTAENVTYTGEKTAAIVIQLMDVYGYGIFDTSNINSTDGVTVQTITFNAESLNTCLQRLTQLDGYDYYVGQGRVTA